jgi:helix-turn-helix protein
MTVAIIPESFVDAARAAGLLGIKPRRILEMARAGQLPAYPLGTGARKTWRFRLSEISAAITAKK